MQKMLIPGAPRCLCKITMSSPPKPEIEKNAVVLVLYLHPLQDATHLLIKIKSIKAKGWEWTRNKQAMIGELSCDDEREPVDPLTAGARNACDAVSSRRD